MLHKLPCSCGYYIPIETNQAGRQVTCQCGKTLQAPPLSKISQLEPLETSNSGSQTVQKGAKSVHSRPFSTKMIVLIIGAIVFPLMTALFIFFTFRYPNLYDVCMINRLYTHEGKVVGRDNQPISQRDIRLLVDERVVQGRYVVLTEDAIKNSPYYLERPIMLLELQDNLKGNREFSYHFKEKYEQLVFYYWARFVIFATLSVLAFALLLVGIFIPRQTEDIGERGGERWG